MKVVVDSVLWLVPVNERGSNSNDQFDGVGLIDFRL